jgi:nitroreductase
MNKSTRTLYRLEGGVDSKALREILEEANNAPSMAALAPWAMVVVEPPFPDVIFEDAVETATPLEVPVFKVADGAGAMIAVLAEKNRPGALEAAWGVVAVLCTAAHSHGLESVVFNPGNETAALELFKAPSWYRLTGIVAIGAPGEVLGTYQAKPLDTCVIVHRLGENHPLPPV